MTLTARQHTVLATVLIIFVAFLVRLGSVEIQPWDEGLYAVRGESIVLHGAVWDQTPYTVGGLYSSLPAPVPAWNVALGVSVFGRTAVGVRIVTILYSAIALLLLYGILVRLVPHRMAMFGMVLAGLSMHWVLYARQAMSEVPLMTFMLLSLWACIRIRELLAADSNWKRPEVLGFVGLLAVGIGFAMLSKLVVGAFPLVFVLLLADKRCRPVAMLTVALSLLIALPWYVSMLTSHADAFLGALKLQHLSSVVEGNDRGLGILYYANQIVVAQPVLVLALLAVVVMWRSVVEGIRTSTERTRLFASTKLVVLGWFAMTFITLTIAPTKNPHYVVTLIPPGMMLAMMFVQHVLDRGSRRTLLFLVVLVLLSAVWSAFPGLRVVAKHSAEAILYGAGMLVLLSIPFVLPSRLTDVITIRGYQLASVAVVAVGSITAAQQIWKPSGDAVITGGRDVATRLIDSGVHSFAYLYHEHTEADSLNPQLAWYTAGWMLGREEGRSYKPVALPKNSVPIDKVAELAFSSQPYIVYYHPNVSADLQKHVYAALAVQYRVVDDGPDYSVLAIAQ